MKSDGSDSSGPVTQRVNSAGKIDTRGKLRIQAEVTRVELESSSLEEELEQLGAMEKASAACNEILENVESRPDPLLPLTHGPVNPSWDIWFEGPQEPQGCSCRML